ncbi:NAC domain-containing protein 104 [Linum perenne]
MGENGNTNGAGNHLPPGFRFYPTDEELVVHFLHRKTTVLPYHPDIIPDLHLYRYDPWELQGKALEEGRQWYYYSRSSQNRVTQNGYWNPLGIDDPILNVSNMGVIGMKKLFMFFVGDVKTNWIMEEYRLPHSDSDSPPCSGRSSRSTRSRSRMENSKRVICRVYERSLSDDEEDNGTELSLLDEVFLSLDDDLDDEITLPNSL